MTWLVLIKDWLPQLVIGLVVATALASSVNVILHKRDPRAAVSWLGFIVLLPLVGSVLYVTLGINRIQRRARALRHRTPETHPSGPSHPCPREQLVRRIGQKQLLRLADLISKVAHNPLVDGNQAELLENGDAAFPVMLDAIERAQRCIALSAYIFDNDAAGQRFVDALARAVRRGVEVRVLIDAVGARYSFPPVTRSLRRQGVPCARFLPTVVPWRWPYMNLRNHRKILVVDGTVGFTGGMNIRHGNLLRESPAYPIRDVHVQIRGPVVTQLQEAFNEDWAFTTGEVLDVDFWSPVVPPAGSIPARGIPDGPDADYDKLKLTLLGAVSSAKYSIRIVTPYFLPEATIVSALNLAAMRGVRVDIVLPAQNNLALVQWASTDMLGDVLGRGCRVWLTPPPFDHAKLMVVDDGWTLLGSGNWDPRTLQLNFEFNVEFYDPTFAARVARTIDARIASAERLSEEALARRSLPIKLRDGMARLVSPFL